MSFMKMPPSAIQYDHEEGMVVDVWKYTYTLFWIYSLGK
jgi:hypothetical protein